MEGAALRRKAETDLAVFAAWHTAVFVLTGYGGKLKSLGSYLGSEPQTEHRSIEHAKGIAFFHRLHARGVGVKITKNEIN